VIKKSLFIACLSEVLTPDLLVLASNCPAPRYSATTLYIVSDTLSVPGETGYYDSRMNRNGLVVVGATTTTGREIFVASPRTIGGYARTTVADTQAGSLYTVLGNTSIDDRNNVAFMGTSGTPGIWQGSVTVNSGGAPVVGIINEVVKQSNSTLNTYSTLISGAGSGDRPPFVGFRARDSASPTPFVFNVYRATYDALNTVYNIQLVNAATNTDVTTVFSMDANNRGDFVVQGVQTLPDPPFTREAVAFVSPDNPAKNAVVSRSGDNLGGFTATGYSGASTLSSDGRRIVSIINIGGAQRTAVAYEGFSTAGPVSYVPHVMGNTSTSELLLITSTAINPDKKLAAWRSTLDGAAGDVIQVAGTDPTAGQPVIDVARTGQLLAGTGLASPVKTLALTSEAWSGGDRDELVFNAVLQDNTQAVVVARLVPDAIGQPPSLPGPAPIGAERQVNTTTAGDQKDPAVDMADDGSFVVTWASVLGSTSSILAQRYDATGTPQGSEIVAVSATAPDVVSEPDVAVNPFTGRFALTWKLSGQFSTSAQIRFFDEGGTALSAPALVVGGHPQTTTGPSIAASANRYAVTSCTTSGPEVFVFLRLYDDDGATLSFPFPVNTQPAAVGVKPNVTIDGSDVTTVGWLNVDGQGVLRQVDAAGAALGPAETLVTDQPLSGGPRIAANSAGELVCTYYVTGLTPIPLEVVHIDDEGKRTHDAVQLNDTATDPSSRHSVAIDDQGAAAGVWLGSCAADIRANWIDGDGTRSAGEYALTDARPGQRGPPDVAMNGSGRAAVVYRTDGQDGDAGGIYTLVIDPQRAILGGEFLVNTDTTGDQNQPALAASDAGDLVVSYITSSSTPPVQVMYRRIADDGAALSSELTVNTTEGTNTDPAVARNAAGLTNVVWQNNADSVWSRYFDGSDVALGAIFQVNQTPTGKASRPANVVLSNGDAWFAWDRATSPTIVGRKFNAAGLALTEEIPINATFAGSSVGMDGSESEQRIAVCWGDGNVYCRVLDLNGLPVTFEFQVNATTAGVQGNPVVAAKPGGFVVAFTSAQQDGDILSRCFDYTGMAMGPEVQVNTYSPGLQAEPTIVADADGNYVIGWTSFSQDGSVAGVYAQWFNADGSRQGNEFRLNSTAAGGQYQPALALTASRRLAAVWTSSGQDGDGDGVYGRIFSNAPPDGDRDDVPDGCDLCPNNVSDAPVKADGCPLSRQFGDVDGDGDVDGVDLDAFVRCALESGPAVPTEHWNCGRFDSDLDGDIDQIDFGSFQDCTGRRMDTADPLLPPSCGPAALACCLPDGTCQVLSWFECQFMHFGQFHSPSGTSCEAVICPSAEIRACCLPNGTCVERFPALCQALGGTVSPHAACAAVVCPVQPPEACCFITDGRCENLRGDVCVQRGGIPRGAGSVCETTECP
jgi:hypothetical protein